MQYLVVVPPTLEGRAEKRSEKNLGHFVSLGGAVIHALIPCFGQEASGLSVGKEEKGSLPCGTESLHRDT